MDRPTRLALMALVSNIKSALLAIESIIDSTSGEKTAIEMQSSEELSQADEQAIVSYFDKVLNQLGDDNGEQGSAD